MMGFLVGVVGTSLFFTGFKVVTYWWMMKNFKGSGDVKKSEDHISSGESFFSFLSIKSYATFCSCYPVSPDTTFKERCLG